jgi:hypothetical protein
VIVYLRSVSQPQIFTSTQVTYSLSHNHACNRPNPTQSQIRHYLMPAQDNPPYLTISKTLPTIVSTYYSPHHHSLIYSSPTLSHFPSPKSRHFPNHPFSGLVLGFHEAAGEVGQGDPSQEEAGGIRARNSLVNIAGDSVRTNFLSAIIYRYRSYRLCSRIYLRSDWGEDRTRAGG